MTLTTSIAEVPANCEIVKIMSAFEFFGRFSQEGNKIWAYPPLPLAMEIFFAR